jgi:hypothetical protein
MKKLSRDEMKNVIGGLAIDEVDFDDLGESDSEGAGCGSSCTGGKKCPRRCPCKSRDNELGSICKR